jgi:putative aminopeptidase FrvX
MATRKTPEPSPKTSPSPKKTAAKGATKKSSSTAPWAAPMPDDQFARMREILAAPSPVGLEAAMTFGVIEPMVMKWLPKGWGIQRFVSNAGLVIDSAPGRDDLLKVMVIGHADKIRMQVRSIGEDGKIWIESDSFLPCTLLGHEVTLFSEDPKKPGAYRALKGGTIEALGAIHFADARLRTGDLGVKPGQLYLDLQVWGADKRDQIEKLGVRAGDTILLDRPIRPGFTPETFLGAYLDNGLGCFATVEAARLLATGKALKNTRFLGAIATHEEIGRMGSRVLALGLKPDIIIGVDVSHDYVAAPGIGDRRMPPTAMGGGYTITTGAIASEQLNSLFAASSDAAGIPWQRSVAGRDTGTDAMAGFFASIDAASTSIGFPIRNMHTISETGCTRDVLASIHAIEALVRHIEAQNGGRGMRRADFEAGHPRLDHASPLEAIAR